MSPFWTLFYAPAIMATLPTMVMLKTWTNWAALMAIPVARRQTRIRGWVATQSAGDNVIAIRPAVTTRSASIPKITAIPKKGSNNVVPFPRKRTNRNDGHV